MHGYRGATTDEYTCSLRTSFFKWLYIVALGLFLATVWTFTASHWFGPWAYAQFDKIVDLRFQVRDLRVPPSNTYDSNHSVNQ